MRPGSPFWLKALRIIRLVVALQGSITQQREEYKIALKALAVPNHDEFAGRPHVVPRSDPWAPESLRSLSGKAYNVRASNSLRESNARVDRCK